LCPDSLSSFLGDVASEIDAHCAVVDACDAISWRPQERQQDFLEVCGFGDVLDGGPLRPPIAPLIGYGGAAGGGKTDADLGLAALAMVCIPGIKIGLCRRTFPELDGADGAISRSWSIIGTIEGARYNESKHRWILPNGSELHFCTCQYEHNKHRYQSAQFGILIIDEATHFTWAILDYMLTRNRTKAAWPGLGRAFPFCVCTTNPGNIGHYWYRQIFVDAGPHDQVNEVETPNHKMERTVFLPAKLEDNPILREIDPDYERKLEDRDEDTARMLRHGDWDIAAGLFFGRYWRSVEREDRPAHIVPDFEVPTTWRLYGSVDYGFAPKTPDEKPFSYGLYAADPVGHIYRVAELAAAHWDPQMQIAEIQRLEQPFRDRGMRVQYRVGCPYMFIKKEENAPTIAETYAVSHVPVQAPITDRVNGWARCLLWLKDGPDGVPQFRSFESCHHFNRQIPSLPQDDHRRDEIDRNAEDHAAEEWRHFLMSRPSPARIAAPRAPDYSSAGLLEKQRAAFMRKQRKR
jgi:hypothetical protein